MLDFKIFLFDWDGTLADSAAVHEMAFRDVLAQWRPDLLSCFDYAAHLGCPTREVFARLGVGDSLECSRLTRLKQARYVEKLDQGALALFQGARELLTRLQQQGRGLFLVTGGSRTSISRALRSTGVDGFFNGIITADDITRGKPDPEGLRLCLERYGLRPQDCVVVEDAASGIAAARALRLPVIGVHDPNVRKRADVWFPTLSAFLAEL